MVNSTGVSTSEGGAGVIQSTASVYLSSATRSPRPRPNRSRKSASTPPCTTRSKARTSGARHRSQHRLGTNDIHGTVYGRRGTNWINAAPFFFKTTTDVPPARSRPSTCIATSWAAPSAVPSSRTSSSGFFSYQHLQVSDQEIGDSFLDVPVGLSDTNRDANGFANLVNPQFGTTLTGANIDRTALALFNSPSLPANRQMADPQRQPPSGSLSHPRIPSTPSFLATGRFKADLGVADLDYNATTKDTVALKYYYQHDPTLAPYAFSSVPGFTQHLDAGAQVFPSTTPT